MISALCWLKRGIMKYKGCIIPWIDFNCPGLGTDLYGSLLWMNSSLFALTSQASRRVLVWCWKDHCLNDWWSLILESTISPSCRFLVVGCLIFAVDVIFLAKDDFCGGGGCWEEMCRCAKQSWNTRYASELIVLCGLFPWKANLEIGNWHSTVKKSEIYGSYCWWGTAEAFDKGQFEALAWV